MLLKNTIATITRPFRMWMRKKKEMQQMKSASNQFEQDLFASNAEKRIIYMGITQHKNLGDLAQHYCILRWIKNYCSDYKLIMIDAPTIVTEETNALNSLCKYYKVNDVIIYQSGYTTQDLGGVHNLMHRMVADRLPQAKVLMMPQTVFFQKEENKLKTAKALNACPNMLFLARDFTSFETAKQMFPNISVMAFPDIVTSLIGSFNFNNTRNKIFLCRRNDDEKYYAEDDLIVLRNRLGNLAPVEMGDTQSNSSLSEILSNLQSYIEHEIERYSHYMVTVTDRYHGTIFSLCAGTPVVIIKTTDHKVTTGADWFKEVYNGYVTVAKDLDEAYDLAEKIVKTKSNYPMLPTYFKEKYYSKTLRELAMI